jgi:hypothetical protein
MACPLLQLTLTLSRAMSFENTFVTFVAMIIFEKVTGSRFQVAGKTGLKAL